MRPPVSVIICTRDRGDSCLSTLSRLLESKPADVQLILVDQSRDDSTWAAVATMAGSDRIVYVPSASRGVSAARNRGAAAATGELLLFTDDDCIPELDWVEAWRNSFASDPDTGVGFGEVTCAPFDPTKGYTATFNTSNGSYGAELFRSGAGRVGMGANMVVLKRVWAGLGGFDEALGAGTRFPASEELDLAYRAARVGYRIRQLAAAKVWHNGYRPGADASNLMRGYVAGIAAMYVKHARCGDLYAIRLLVGETRHHVLNVTGRLLSRTRPLGLVALLYFLGSVGSAWRSPLDARRHLYRSAGVAPTQ
jgi:GT2 family glycosyltransferase